MRLRSTLVLALALFAFPAAAVAQQREGVRLDGVVFGNWQMRIDSAARAATGGKAPNKFDLARIYLNVRAPAGDKGSIRITTDLFQNTGGGGYYAGWAARFKYAYFQYDATRSFLGVDGMPMNARIGMIQNFVIEHVDTFWPRWLSQDELETNGFFTSADVGAGATVTFPQQRGEFYTTIVNGTGYSAAETDRFKDVAARVTWTPFGSDSGFFQTLSISPWYMRGRSGGAFANGGVGQVEPVTEGIQRDRRGLFVGVRDRRVTVGMQLAQRVEEVEGGDNTVAVPRTVRDRTSDLKAGFAFIRPLEIITPGRRSRLQIFARYDDLRLDEVTNASTTLRWAGLIWDLNARTSFTIDLQESRAKAGTAVVPTRTWFIHWVANY